MENRIGAEERYPYKTCKEAIEACLGDEEIVIHSGQMIKNPRIVKCYEPDIKDLKEALKTAVKYPENLRRHVRAFVDAYKNASPLFESESLHLSPRTMWELKAMATHFNKTEEEIVSLLLKPYFTNLSC